jgi:molecular chaperone Hsp33
MDALVRAILPGELKAVIVNVTEAARLAVERHGLKGAAAGLLAQGFAAGVLLASLQKGKNRVNLQLECDGPLRGFFVDASADGEVRGYVKNPNADVELGDTSFRWRAVLGNSGFISVLRDIGNEYYRSSVELVHMDIAKDLTHYFATSDQTPTFVGLETVRTNDGELVATVGVLVQGLPGADLQALKRAQENIDANLISAAQRNPSVTALLDSLFPGVPPLVDPSAVTFKCTCSKERAMQTLLSLGPAEVQDIVDTMGSTAVTCHFCGQKHEITLIDLLHILDQLGRPQARG